MSFTILNAEPEDYSRKAVKILEKVGKVIEKELSQDTILDEIKGVDALIVRLGIKVSRELIEKGGRLKYILSATTGTDHIDLEAAKEKGIEVICLKGEETFLRTIPSTSEHTWALLLAILRNLNAAANHVLEDGWNRQLFRGNNLLGKKIGILGLGRVGRHVARYAMAFNCKVAAYDPYKTEWLDGVQRFDTAEALLGWSDILSIHIPLDDSTNGFLNKELLQHLPKGAILVNTSRGGVWDEDAILELLDNKHLGGVATDVIQHEQDVSLRAKSKMIAYAKEHTNLLITPHIAGATFESMEMTEIFIANKLKTIHEKNSRKTKRD